MTDTGALALRRQGCNRSQYNSTFVFKGKVFPNCFLFLKDSLLVSDGF